MVGRDGATSRGSRLSAIRSRSLTIFVTFAPTSSSFHVPSSSRIRRLLDIGSPSAFPLWNIDAVVEYYYLVLAADVRHRFDYWIGWRRGQCDFNLIIPVAIPSYYSVFF